MDDHFRAKDPLSLRYLFLQTHYRKELNFTFDALRASEIALFKLRKLTNQPRGKNLDKDICEKYLQEFMEAINNDLNTPKALGVAWKLAKLKDSYYKRDYLLKMDEIFGVDLHKNYDKDKT